MSWVARLFGLERAQAAELVALASYRAEERIARCNGVDPLDIVVAYAQDRLVYTPDNRLQEVSTEAYENTPKNDRVNKFGQAYKSSAPLLLQPRLADVVVDAAIDLYTHQGLRLRVYDGLRTVEAAQTMYDNADPAWLAAGLLAKPGESAHNRALAVDSVVVDAQGREVERFDNLDMTVNHRDYQGPEASPLRLVKEQAFQRAAMQHGLALAPLQSEYWDDRVPGSPKDLWRVIASLARVSGQARPTEKAEDYATFAAQWRELNRGGQLTALLGEKASAPPPEENLLFHERLASIQDYNLPAAWQQTERNLNPIVQLLSKYIPLSR